MAPAGARAPLIVHVPHASTEIPDDVRPELLLSDAELAHELLRLTDWYTDELYAGLAELGATYFIDRLSRLVFDPERFLDDTGESAAAAGQGVVYTHGSAGQRLREPDPELRARRIEELYKPYHAALDGVVAEMLDVFGTCTLIDGHSFPTVRLPTEIDQASDRPDICIGTDATHTPPQLAIRLETEFRAAGLLVKCDSPFEGTFVPGGYFGRDGRVHSVMIEVRRGLYMDEESGDRSGALPALRDTISRAVAAALPG